MIDLDGDSHVPPPPPLQLTQNKCHQVMLSLTCNEQYLKLAKAGTMLRDLFVHARAIQNAAGVRIMSMEIEKNTKTTAATAGEYVQLTYALYQLAQKMMQVACFFL